MPLGRITFLVLLAVVACAQSPQPLPPGVSLTVRLESALDTEKAEQGDLLVATVTKDVKQKGKVIVPAKATLRGRLRVLDRKSKQVAIGMQFTELEFAGTKTPVILELERVITQLPGTQRVDLPALDRQAVPQTGAAESTIILNEPRGTGTFVVPRRQFKIPHLEMVWRTLPPE